jgi:DNA-binding response OmpR family regulator
MRNGQGAPRILVVDDEPNIRLPLIRALGLSGYGVEGADCGDAALKLIARDPYDLMVLDMRMPGMDGVDVMYAAKQIRPEILILILTGHATLDSAIAAVKSEAVDYMIKPVGTQEIIAAIERSLHKRVEQARRQGLIRTAMEALREADTLHAPILNNHTDVLPVEKPDDPRERFRTVGVLTLDRSKRLVIVNETPMRSARLTEGEISVFEVFMDAPAHVFSCRQLTQKVWGYELDESEAQSLVRPYIFRLRQKIEVAPDAPIFIRTIRGRGYLLASAIP